MKKNKQLAINLITTMFVLIINIFINFFLSSYIVKAIGESAYGFVSLANNFVSYAAIFTTALNSMASRFITLNIHKKDLKSANEFFSSVLIANVILVLILAIPTIALVLYLEYFINTPIELLTDVKILFTLIFINFFISLIGGVFTVATYCKNKLYLTSLRNMESTILKVGIIVGLFMLFTPALFYIGIATLVSSIYVLLFNMKYTKKLMPEIKIKKENFSFEKIKILLSSGLWNSITNIGNVLADGLDLIISNIAIGASTMGVVAIAKVPGTVFSTLIANITNVFQPQILEYYAKEEQEQVANEIIKSMKISGIFGNIPFSFIVIFGSSLCSLWMPNVEQKLLTILCIITFINVYSGGLINPLYNVFTIANKVKLNAILNISSGLVSTLIVLLLLKITNGGAYVIVGVSAVVGLLKGFIIVPVYAAKCVNSKITIFFPTIIKYIIATVFMIAIFSLLHLVIKGHTWISLFISVVICGIIGLIVNFIVLLNKEEVKYFINIFKRKLFKRSSV